MKYITKTVWVLSIVSMFTDTAGEMLYPVMPIYLKSIGFSVLLIGILEGIAEATSGISKGYFGQLSDNTQKRVPFVQAGYAISAVSKSIMVAFANPVWIFFTRTADRFGKGLRTGARDAMLSDEATYITKGKVFGFHRSMDTLGAVFGPTIALIYLYYYPQQYKTLFYIAFIPGICAVAATFYIKDKRKNRVVAKKKTTFFSFMSYWKNSPLMYRKVVIALLVFTLFNSSDVFLLLKAKQAGLDDAQVIGVYIFYNLIYAIFSFPVGIIADKVGLKKILIFGLFAFAIVYFGMSISNTIIEIAAMFFLYGIYAASTEGISKAWISNITAKKDTATAIGTFSGFQSVCTMLASSLTGLIWFQLGASVAFITTASVTLIVISYLIFIPNPVVKKDISEEVLLENTEGE